MSYPILSMGNAQNWQLLYSHHFVSEAIFNQGRISGHVPIPEQTLSVLSEHRILVAGAHSRTAKSTWYTGGYLTAIVETAGEFLDADLASYRVPLNSARLILLPQLAQSYKLRFRPQRWFEEITLNIYQYIGSEADSTEVLLRQIETKIDQL